MYIEFASGREHVEVLEMDLGEPEGCGSWGNLCLTWCSLEFTNSRIFPSFQLKTAPVLENFEYASSDEDIWDALSDGKQEVKPREPVQINTTCEWQRCNAQFTDNNEFLDHIQKHLKDVPKHEGHEYLCEWDLCDFKCNSLSTFERHVLYHEMHGRFLSAGESLELMHKLPKCSLSGLDRNRLPELPSDFVCLWRECNVVFKSVSLLHDHIVQHCTDEYHEKKLISCQWRGCSYTAKRLSQLKTHIGRMHTQILVYACRKCGASRKSERTFFAHFLSQAPVKSEFFHDITTQWIWYPDTPPVYSIHRSQAVLPALQSTLPQGRAFKGPHQEPTSGDYLWYL